MLKLTTSCDDEVLNTDLHYMTSIDFDIKISLTIIFIYACNIHAKNKDDIYEVAAINYFIEMYDNLMKKESHKQYIIVQKIGKQRIPWWLNQNAQS